LGCNHYIWSIKDICYFCSSVLDWKNTQIKDDFVPPADGYTITLADGCTVPACMTCYHSIGEGRKLAEERGLYDPNKAVRGGDRMKVEKGNTGGNNLKVEFVEERKLIQLKILDEGRMETYEPQKEGEKSSTKLVCGVSYDGQKTGDPTDWSMNNKSRNALIDIFGDDTAAWVGKEVEITLEGTGEFKHIMVDVLRTKK